MHEPVITRPAVPEDLSLVRRTLHTALAWNPADPIPPFEVVVDHPGIEVYHIGWMRLGDAGVVAEVNGEFVGMAYCRLFEDGGGSQGFYDAGTPELAVAVEAESRGRGIGERLIVELSDVVRAGGAERMSLSVSQGNPAIRLYLQLGYREVSEHDGNILMVADLV